MPEITKITSPQNPRLKKAARLRQRRGRKQQGRTILDGIRETSMALESGWPVRELYCRDSARDHDRSVQTLIAEAESRGVAVFAVVDSAFDKLAFGDRDEGVVAVADEPALTLDRLDLPAEPLLCVLDRVEKPGNVGAVLRTADAAGADAVVLSDPRTDPFNPNAIRASLGAVFRVPLAVASAAELLPWLRRRQVRILAARVEAASDYDAPLYRGATAIVLGNEAAGLGADWDDPDVTAVTIPMHGRVNSLNVSASAAILLFEAVRQRRRRSSSQDE